MLKHVFLPTSGFSAALYMQLDFKARVCVVCHLGLLRFFRVTVSLYGLTLGTAWLQAK